jgi:hypothetical protein
MLMVFNRICNKFTQKRIKMRIYTPKENLAVYADRYWPQKPITIPANPSIKFEHTIKKSNNSAQAGNLTDLLASMKNPVTNEEKEEYTNSALLTYSINGKDSSVIVYPGDWVVVYQDGMVVIKKHEQFVREYDEHTTCNHQQPDNPGVNGSAVLLREKESSSNANVNDTVHNTPS